MTVPNKAQIAFQQQPTRQPTVDPRQQANLMRQLSAFKDRLLNIDLRNPSLFLRRIVKKRSFDLANLSAQTREQAWVKAAKLSGEVLLVPNREESDESLQQRADLLQLSRFSDALTEETGLQELFLGLCWLEGHVDPHTYLRGPLLLVPISLKFEREGRRAGWHLAFDEAREVQSNEAMLAALKKFKDFETPEDLMERIGHVLESSSKDPACSAQTFFTNLASVVKEVGIPIQSVQYDAGAKIRPLTNKDLADQPPVPLKLTNYLVAGLFPQTSTSLFLDFENMIERAEDGEVQQGIVDNLVEAPADDQGGNPQIGDVALDAVSDKQLNLVLPSDPSQDAVVVKAQSAECLVVRGPPGTGKSQVIVNLVADALSRGDRVLVVCQKRAALDVVYDRLSQVGLGHGAFVVHDPTADRPDIYKKISTILSDVTNSPADSIPQGVSALSEEIDLLIAEIRKIVEPLGREFHGIRLSRIYGRAKHGFKPSLNVPAELAKLNDKSLTDLTRTVNEAKQGTLRFDLPTRPLAGRGNWSTLGHFDQIRIAETFKKLAGVSHKGGPSRLISDARLRALLLEASAVYEQMKDRWYRHILPSWYSARSVVGANQMRMKNLPVSQWPEALTYAQEIRDSLFGLDGVMSKTWFQEISALVDSPEQLHELTGDILATVERDFADIQQHDQIRSKLSEAHINVLLHCAEALDPSVDWGETLFHEINLRWIDEAESKHTALKGQPFQRYEQLRQTLQQKLDAKQKAVAKDLAASIRNRQTLPTFPPDLLARGNRKAQTDWNRLTSEAGKKRSIRPLRGLLKEYPWPMRNVCPCWLATPEAVSEIFPLERGLFDLIIFDEASQLAVERALPVIYRGKRTVIAGDEQQMPPSHFFQSASADGEDADVDGEDDALAEAKQIDSLLMLAKRIYGFDYLSWHYRSEFQELIDFSNHGYYDGKLIIAANISRTADPPITWVPVKGIWENRRNQVEAQKTVEILRRQLEFSRDFSFRSTGVITFNERQQEEIKDEIERQMGLSAEFAELWALANNPPSGRVDDKPFIKNIENVQGDERDVIIFSIGYADDPSGVMRKQFGPLSVEGGENRLNVAVTRARKAMHVICSFDPDTLAVETLKNLGPRRFKQFLCYAKAVGQKEEPKRKKVISDLNPAIQTPLAKREQSFDSPFEEQVYEAIIRAGYQVETQWGVGNYRIDLAIVDPEVPAKFCLGIECDGEAFHSGKSVRERDLARQRFLESRGWKIARIWSRNWWLNPRHEIRRILSLIPAKKVTG
ncbi:MAG: DUF4011 domain-containing protein [Planctomycetes bacterium]|nr:DUF4011 domain-containing protein [Planctomycetota bacterium]